MKHILFAHMLGNLWRDITHKELSLQIYRGERLITVHAREEYGFVLIP